MVLDDLVGDCVFDVVPSLVVPGYWEAQRYLWRDGAEHLRQVFVDPVDWAAPLVGGVPIIHQGMFTYWPVKVCREYQARADAWRRANGRGA